MFHLFKRTPASVAAAAAGMIRVFVDSTTNRFMAKDESGNLIDMKGDPGTPAILTLIGGASNAIGTGTKNFTFPVQSNLAWAIGTRLRAANGVNWVEGPVTAITSASVTIEADLFSGSGTFSSWNIGIAGERGQMGPSGLIKASFGVSFANTEESQIVEVIDAGISPTNPPQGLTVQSAADWDISYTVTVDSVANGSFEVLVTAQDINGDPLIGLPLPDVTVTYLKPLN